ncbi:polyprenyl synthetase family protein [Halobacteriovorax sp. HLS]|uniref:polyprenyl synthetase family protein n=1 Tax=Halobacteriovorax sp. HLS TaxID=2234000 RepID=UPI0013E30E56|nr:polyprenyl synthetase family protein [Halobacteriovorax sp. HLS]
MLQDFLSTIPLKTLKHVKDMDLNISSPNCNKAINDLLQNSVLVGGKRLRPLLTYLVGSLFGQDFSKVAPYAKSIELVHAASLSHDDVIDNATTRRNVASINIQASNKKAVLAGDYLLADVIVGLTQAGNLELVGEMAKVIQDLAVGEWIQSDAIENRDYTSELIETIAIKKTASVMSWCCFSPAILAGHSAEVVEKARQMGIDLGIAFQLMDDTLDFSESSQKDANLDLENGLVNAVLFQWLQLNPSLNEKYKAGEGLISIYNGEKIDKAVEIVKQTAMSHINSARSLLDEIQSDICSNEKEVKAFEKNKKPILYIFDYLTQRRH